MKLTIEIGNNVNWLSIEGYEKQIQFIVLKNWSNLIEKIEKAEMIGKSLEKGGEDVPD